MQSKKTFHFLSLKNVPILKQLQIEEALLRTSNENFIIANHGSTPAIIMGISGKTEKLVNMSLMKKNPVTLIKRFSGGGTVFVDENTLFFSFICNSDDTQAACFPCQVHCFVEKIYKQVFSDQFKLIENDYVLGEKKFGGNAQYLQKGRWLHHTSLLWDFKQENMEYLLMPEKIPKYRNKRTHSEFLTKLCDMFPTKETLHDTFQQVLNNHFEIKQISLEEIDQHMQAPHRKSTTIF